MNNIGDTATSNEIVLNSFQSQIFAEVIKKFKKFGISGYDIDFESYIVQKSLAEHIASTISSEEQMMQDFQKDLLESMDLEKTELLIIQKYHH